VALSEAQGAESLLASASAASQARNEGAGSADWMHEMMNADGFSMAEPDCDRQKYIYCQEWQFVH
jgi:hypothetical protein